MGTVSLPLQPDKSPTVKTNIKNGWTHDFIDYLLSKTSWRFGMTSQFMDI
jgi:hypothetical protein